MILLSELSRRRIRSINKVVRVNRAEACVVIRVDKEKGTTHTHPTSHYMLINDLSLHDRLYRFVQESHHGGGHREVRGPL